MRDREDFLPWEVVILLIMAVQGAMCAALVNYNLYTDIILVLFVCLYCIFVNKYKLYGYKLKILLSCVIAVVLVVCEIFNLISVRYWALAIFVIACNVYSIVEVMYIRKNRTRYIWRRKFTSKFKRAMGNLCIGLVVGIITVASNLIVVYELEPDMIVSKLSQTPITNEYEWEIVRENGTKIIKDIKYSDNYDNSYIDVYISPKANKNSPTFFYVHGGAYAMGDKTGQGFGLATHYIEKNYFDYYIDKGYNIVSVNYAMSPENKYPTQLNQLVEAVEYTIKNCDYVNMNDVVFGGESAGGNLIGQFVNIQTNKEYAELLGIQPVIDKKNIHAVVFTSALLDNARMDNTGNAYVDYIFNLFGRSYFGVWSLNNNEEINKTNVITYVTEDFPPTYISDGNYRSFSEQATELSNKLSDLGVVNILNYYEKDVVKLGHVYEYQNNMYSVENVNNTLEFLEKVKKIR